jgi:lysozyme
MASDLLIESIVQHEGTVKNAEGLHLAYWDHKGNLTIGYGCLLDEHLTITDKLARELMLAELAEKEEQLHSVTGWKEAGPVRRSVLLELAYWMGVGGCLRFKRMWAAVRAQDWATAAAEMRDSETWRDPMTRGRMETLAGRMATGEWS